MMLMLSPALLLLVAPVMTEAGGTEAPEAQGPSATDRGGSLSLGRPYTPSGPDKSVNQNQPFYLPQYQYTSGAGRDQTRHMLPMAGPPGGFYRGQLQDKSSYRSSGFLVTVPQYQYTSGAGRDQTRHMLPVAGPPGGFYRGQLQDKSSYRSSGFLVTVPQYQYTSGAGRDQTRHMLPMAGPPGGFYRGQLQDKSSYRSSGFLVTVPQYQYTSGAGRDQTRHMLPMAGPPGGFYRGQLQDKSSYRSSGFLTSKSAPSLALGYTPRIPIPTVQDPLQNRLGGFNLPPSAAFHQHRFFPTAGGLHQPVGVGFGTKDPAGHNHPLVPPYHMRGSRVFDNISYKSRDPTKKTGVYVVPSPSKLYYDGVKQ